jgi:ubiquinone/menaquinone biosynthesis C-methylase UbiE
MLAEIPKNGIFMTLRNNRQNNWVKDSQSFDTVSDLYDQFRPSYPPALIERTLSLTGIPAGGQILEIGCGTGQATRLFAQKGFSVHCIEPGKNLIRMAAQRLREYPRVTFERSRFEDWPVTPNRYDLAVSAQAFHWVKGEVGFPKAARALKSDGYIALFWNMYPGTPGVIEEDLEQVYRERAPELVNPPEKNEEVIRQRAEAIQSSGCFASIAVERFPWSAQYDARQYIGLLNTYSDHLRLSERTRRHFFEGVSEVIRRHGGSIAKPYLAVLYVAKRIA